MRKVKLWLALMAILVATAAGAQSTISVTAAEYFFDTDPGYGKATVINNAVEGEQTLDIPTSALSAGAHTLCVRSLGSNGVWSSTMTKSVYVMHAGSSIHSVEYFFDSDPGYGKGTVSVLGGAKDVTLDINTATIAPGAHMLYLRTQDTNGNWSPVMAHPLYVFTVLPVAALEYYIDNNDPGEGKAISVPVATATAATATFDIDTSVLTPGEHTLNIRAMGIDSVWTAVSTRKFNVEGPVASEPEPYAVLTNDTLLTFYYDDQKAARGGIDINNSWVDYDSGSPYGSATTAVIDASFADYRPTSTAYWFMRCPLLTNIMGMENLKTENVTYMSLMFQGCSALTSLDVTGFNTQNVEDMGGMFYGCFSLTSLDVTGFNTQNVENMRLMFQGCSALTTIYAGSEWTTANVTDSNDMFADCTNLVGGKGTTYDANHIDKEYAHIDGGSSNPGYFTDKNATPAIAEAYAVLSDNNTVLFYYDTEKQARGGMDINNDYIDKTVTPPYGTATKAIIDASFADYRPTSTGYWFQNCNSLTTITGMENLKTDNVWDMHYMFAGCSSLTTLDVSNFKTDNVKYMIGMFSGCSSLTTLDVSNFKTDNVLYMGDMFGNCSSLISLNLSGFKTDNVQDMNIYDMFDGCSSLAAIQAGNANIPAEGYARIGNPNLLVYVNEPSLAPQGVQNVVVNGLAKDIVLTDEVGTNDNNNFFVPQSFTAEKITYTRNFTQQTQPNVSRGWESISLPFNVQNIVHESKGDLSPFGSSADGKKFWLRRLAGNGLTRASQIEANVPYVISMPNSTEYTDLYNLAGRVTFSAQNTTVPATTPQTMSLSDGSIEMVPTTLRVNRSSSVWALNVGEVRGQYLEGSVFERDYRMVRPFQAYTVHNSNGPAPRFVPISEMDSGATNIEKVANSQQPIANGMYYDLNGRKLQQKPSKKGVYIMNGAKVVIK